MAQEPSGTGGQQPTEYDYSRQRHPGEASEADPWNTAGGAAPTGAPAAADGGIPDGAVGYDAWGNPQPGGSQDPYAAQQQYPAQQQYTDPAAGQDQSGSYYGGYATQSYDPAQAQPYAAPQQGYDPGNYGYDTSGAYGNQAQPYAADQYQTGQYAAGQYPAGQYQADQYQAGQYAADQYPAGQYAADQYPAGQYQSAPYASTPYGDQAYSAEPYSGGVYGGETYTADAQAQQDHQAQQDQDRSADPYGYQQAAPAPDATPGADDATRQWQIPDQGVPAAPAAPATPPQPPTPPPAAAPGFLPSGALRTPAAGPQDEQEPTAAQEGSDRSPSGGGLAARLRAAATGGRQGLDRRTLAVRGAIGVTALVVLVGVGAYVEGGSGSDAPAGGSGPGSTASARFSVDHVKAWTAQATAGGSDSDDTLVGSWLLAKAAVRADGTGVHAYDTATGKALWTLTPPSSGAVPCGMSPTVNSKGVGAVLFRPKGAAKACTLLSAVDTASGKQKWTKTLSDTKDAYAARTLVNDSRVIAVGDSKAVGYDADSGKSKWTYKGRGKFCTLSGSGSDSTVLLHSSCADSSPKEQIVSLGAEGGRLSWWRGLGSPKTVSVLSAEPAVVLTTGAEEADDTVRSWNDKGDPGAEIKVARDGGRLDVGHGPLDAAPAVFFQGGTMVAALIPADAGTAANASLTAVDLKTGKATWTVTAKEKGKVQPVGIDADAVSVATEERTDQSAHLSRFALTDGAESAGGGFPRDTGSVLTSGRLLTDDNLVVAVPTFTSTYGSAATAFRTKG
jgi:hypothetical protein